MIRINMSVALCNNRFRKSKRSEQEMYMSATTILQRKDQDRWLICSEGVKLRVEGHFFGLFFTDDRYLNQWFIAETYGPEWY